jgi:hypothetical protein
MTIKNTILTIVGCSPFILMGVGMIADYTSPGATRVREYYASPAYKTELAERKAAAKAICDAAEYKAARLHDAADELNRRADDILHSTDL